MYKSVSWEQEIFNGHSNEQSLWNTVIGKSSLKLQAKCNIVNQCRATHTFSKISEYITVWSEPGAWISENTVFSSFISYFNKIDISLQTMPIIISYNFTQL